MKFIVISSPEPFENETVIFQQLLKVGVAMIHLRKPTTDLETVRAILKGIPTRYHSKIKLHYYTELLDEFPLIGYHHSSKTDFNEQFKNKQSKSFHSFEAIQSNKYDYEYFFLSPVFPSISKVGYLPNYTFKEFEIFLKTTTNCIALGGICKQNIGQLQGLGFSGVALLGELWKEKPSDVVAKFVEIRKELNR